MRRVHVVGTTGSGKTTLARRLAVRVGVPHVELDALRHGPNWTELPDDAFQDAVREFRDGDWVVDGNYAEVRSLLWERADTIVWLDYSLPVTFGRALRRTVRRVATRETLWNGNRETFANAFLAADGVPLWVLKTYRRRRRDFGASLPAWESAAPGRTLVRLSAPKLADAWLEAQP